MSDLKTFNYTTTVPSTTWSINHNLNITAANIDVIVHNDQNLLEKILPYNIVTNDTNNITISFSVNRTGFARITGSV